MQKSVTKISNKKQKASVLPNMLSLNNFLSHMQEVSATLHNNPVILLLRFGCHLGNKGYYFLEMDKDKDNILGILLEDIFRQLILQMIRIKDSLTLFHAAPWSNLFQLQSGLIATYSGPIWETLPFSWYHNQATLPLSQSHLVQSLKLFLSFFSEEDFNEKFKYCFRSSKSSATSYQKIPNQWRVPLSLSENYPIPQNSE